MQKTVDTVNTLTFKSKTSFKNYIKNVEIMPAQYNRPTSDSHIASMTRSIKEIGIQRGIVVVITSAFNGKKTRYVADGQHLKQGILNVDNKDLSGHLVIFENHIEHISDIIPFVSRMNSTAKNWTLKEYLNAWCTHGLEDYNFIREVKRETGYSLNGLIEAYSNKLGYGNGTFKNGKFVADKKVGGEILKSYKVALTMGLCECNSSFLAFVRFVISDSKIDMIYVMNKIKENKHIFSLKSNRDTYVNMFEGLVRKEK